MKPSTLTSITDSDDCTQAYGDAIMLDLSEMEFSPCGRSGSGHCEYEMVDGIKRCIFCGREREV